MEGTNNEQASIVIVDDFGKEPASFGCHAAASKQGPTLLCITDSDIYCKASAYKPGVEKTQANFLVVGVVDPGWSKVPYFNNQGKTVMGERPKPLAEWAKYEDDAGGTVVDRNKLICYPYLIYKGKQKDKGPRIDGSDPAINNGEPVSFTLEHGMVIRCMMKKSGAIGGSDREKRENLFPQDMDVIPAFSRVIIQVAIKGWDKLQMGDMDPITGQAVQSSDLSACYRGYGCGVTEIRPASGSINSDWKVLESVVPTTAEEMRMKQNLFVEKNEPIKQTFQVENVPFVVKTCSKNAYCAWDPDHSIFRVMQWSEQSTESIDIQEDVLIAACNSAGVGTGDGRDAANQLLDVALGMGAVRFLCNINEYRGRDGTLSRITGAPILDSTVLLSSVCRDTLAESAKKGETVTFSSGHTLGDGPAGEEILVVVDTVSSCIEDGEVAPTPEFPLICKGIRAERAYKVSFVGKACGPIWTGFFNASRPCFATRGAGASAMGNAASAVALSRNRWGKTAASSGQGGGGDQGRAAKKAKTGKGDA